MPSLPAGASQPEILLSERALVNIFITRTHALGLIEARKVAFRWAETAEQELGMSCTYAEGDAEDEVSFTRSGVDGILRVTAEDFELRARLGFLLGAFKSRIEAEILRNLDEQLANRPTPKPQRAPRGSRAGRGGSGADSAS